MRTIELADGSRTKWRFRGEHPSEADYRDDMARYQQAYAVTSRADGERIGLVGVRDHDRLTGVAHLQMVAPPGLRSARVVEAVGACVLTAYTRLGVRKLCAEVPEFAWGSIARGEGRHFRLEGRLRQHITWDDHYWDLYVIAFDRDDWLRREDEMRRLIGMSPTRG